SVAAAPDGSFVVTWTSGGQDPDPALDLLELGVYGQVLAADGHKLGANFRANTTLSGDQTSRYSDGGLAVGSDGSFVVGWQGNGPGDSDGTFLQRFRLNPNDAPVAATTAISGVRNTAIAIDLRTLVSDEETTDKDDLTFTVSGAVGGTSRLLGDGHTAWFTPSLGVTGAARVTHKVRDLPHEQWAALTGRNTVTVNVLPGGTVIAVASTLKALNLGNVARAEIRAPAVTSLVVAGDFFGDLVLTGLAGSTLPALGSARIDGQLVESTWQVTGGVGTISAL